MADLDEVVRAHIANQAAARPPALDALLHRARRRRQRQLAGMVAGVAAAVLGFGSLAAGAGVPWTQQRDTARYAAPVATGGILDEGVAEEGSWKVVAENDAEEGWCVRYITPSGDGGVCDLATPGRLDEVALFATSDGAEPITVVAGGVPEATSTVEVGLSDGTVARALVRTVSGRPFFSIRIPAAVTVARLTALDPDGRVLEERGPLPPPPPPPPLMPPSMPPALMLQSELRRAMAAMESHRNAEGTYTRDPNALGEHGFASGKVLIFLPYADENGYCIEATSSTDTKLVFHASDTTSDPGEGRCPER